MSYEEKLNAFLKKELKEEIKVNTSPEPKMGDYGFACFVLAKKKGKNPNEIAKQLARTLKKLSFVDKIAAIGPYVNFFIKKSRLAKDILEKINKEKNNYGKGKSKKEKTMVEYCSPNTNKPLHLGHLRNIVLGQSIINLLKLKGSDVVSSCLVNDKGTHICKSMLAYKKWGKNSHPNKKSDHFVGDFYVLFTKNSTEQLEKEAQDLLKKWEKGDKQTLELWKKMNNWVYKGFNETYKQLGVKFDKLYYESKLYNKGKDIILDGVKKSLFYKDYDNAVVVDLKKQGLTKKVLLRADGTSIYITQDIYLAKKKFDDFKLNKSIYIVASEQNLHFQQLFAILKILGYKWASGCYHLSYGMVYLPEGKMKSREGKVVDADDIIEEMISLAKKEITKRYKNLAKKEIEKRAKAIGLGALRFFMLKMDYHKDMTYDPKESISFEGETGPYIQYAYARICSIFRKFKGKIGKVDYNVFGEKELQIIKMLAKFPETVDYAAEKYKPSIITRYLLDLSQMFNEFYHSSPVLKAEEKIKNARLFLINSVKQVIENGLSILGIEVLEEM